MALPDGPGILVTDYRLPGMTGADLVREIRQTRDSPACGRDQRLHRRADDLRRQERRRRFPAQAGRLRLALPPARGGIAVSASPGRRRPPAVGRALESERLSSRPWRRPRSRAGREPGGLRRPAHTAGSQSLRRNGARAHTRSGSASRRSRRNAFRVGKRGANSARHVVDANDRAEQRTGRAARSRDVSALPIFELLEELGRGRVLAGVLAPALCLAPALRVPIVAGRDRRAGAAGPEPAAFAAASFSRCAASRCCVALMSSARTSSWLAQPERSARGCR